MRENTPTIRPQDVQVPPEALLILNRAIAERFQVCPLAITQRNGMKIISVALADPGNIMILDQLQQQTGCRINPVKASEGDILAAIEQHYSSGHAQAPTDLLKEMGGTVETPSIQTPEQASQGQASDGRGATGAVESILQRAINDRASDIHIEPHPKIILVRTRIDGIMYDQTTYEPANHPQVISRIKILSKLDIAQSRLPQDGRFEVAFGKNEYDIRVSIIPSTSGEKAVLRLLPKSPVMMELSQLGMEGRNREMMEQLLTKPFGMLLATGPTGSGKTTTLYSSLSKIDCTTKNVITVEDPVEYQFGRVTQMQVHPKIGLTFAVGLRAILRQDPDVIMVGEIRDLETLEIAIQAALTGHLVLSTLHCNDAAAGAARMVDMGAEPFLVASSLNALTAQRLIRKVCPYCKEPDQIDDVVRQRMQLPDDNTVYYRGKGCDSCRHTGYLGRLSVFEVIPMVSDIQHAIVRKASAGEIREIIHELKYPTLLEDGIGKARAGITSVEEIVRSVFTSVF